MRLHLHKTPELQCTRMWSMQWCAGRAALTTQPPSPQQPCEPKLPQHLEQMACPCAAQAREAHQVEGVGAATVRRGRRAGKGLLHVVHRDQRRLVRACRRRCSPMLQACKHASRGCLSSPGFARCQGVSLALSGKSPFQRGPQAAVARRAHAYKQQRAGRRRAGKPAWEHRGVCLCRRCAFPGVGPRAEAGRAPAASAARPAEGAASPLACGACSASALTRSIRSSSARPSRCGNAAAGFGASLCCACTHGTRVAARPLLLQSGPIRSCGGQYTHDLEQ